MSIENDIETKLRRAAIDSLILASHCHVAPAIEINLSSWRKLTALTSVEFIRDVAGSRTPDGA
jgi:hypothetical protein